MESIQAQQKLSIELKNQAKKLGFDPVGIAIIPGGEKIQLRTAALQRWLNQGNQADMHWMEAPRRQNAKTLLTGAKSLLAVGLNYYVSNEKDPGSLSIARYAWGKDYHKILEKRLKRIGNWLTEQRPKSQWKICVDSSPLLEKAWAEEAGLGWIGKHSNLINSKNGSWFVLGHLLSTEELIPDQPAKPQCGKCDKCIKACPTKAITEPFVIDSRLCLAYHTIENRNHSLPINIKNSLGTWVAGCDICQDICPWNKKDLESSTDPDTQPKDWILKLTKKDVLAWDEQKWKKKLQGSALKRIKPWMWRRNASAIQTSKKNS